MSLIASITKRNRRRCLKSGVVVVQTRFVVNFREPRIRQAQAVLLREAQGRYRQARRSTYRAS